MSEDHIGQLEPGGLIDSFLAHPPLGFRIEMVDGTPAFIAPFDLLTTADDVLRRRVMRAPGFRWWGRWLRWRTAFVGTTVAEYALFPHAADALRLPAILRDALGRGQRLLIVKDIPQTSPLLDPETNAWYARFAASCADAGFVLMDGQALAYVPIDFADEAEFLARLSPGRRRDIRRKLRSRDTVDVQTLLCGDAHFDDDATVDAYYCLYLNVYAQSEIHFDQLSREFFAAVLRDAHAGGIVFVYRHAGAMIGWNLCYVAGGKLIDKYVGFAYPQAREHNLYFTSWFGNLAYARAQGLTHYVAGWTDPEIKAYLGARFTLTRHAVYLRSRLVRALARQLAKHFESDSRWVPNGD